MDDDEVKREICRVLHPRFLWLRAWHLHFYCKLPWKEVGSHLHEHYAGPYWRPLRPGTRTLAESTARQHGRRGQQWETYRDRPLYFWLTIREHKALRALGVDPLAPDAVAQAGVLVRSYKGRRLPPSVGKRSFHSILNLLDDLDEAGKHC